MLKAVNDPIARQLYSVSLSARRVVLFSTMPTSTYIVTQLEQILGTYLCAEESGAAIMEGIGLDGQSLGQRIGERHPVREMKHR